MEKNKLRAKPWVDYPEEHNPLPFKEVLPTRWIERKEKTHRKKESKKARVSIWCKIYTNNFSEEMFNKTATGKEIYDFLMKDSGNCFDDHDRLIPGDCNLWYLGCNEKFGELRYDNKIWRWGFGESSFYNVEIFVTWIYMNGMFTQKQYQTLIEKIEEGKRIGDMYLIKDYLICQRKGQPWPMLNDNLREAMG